MSAIGTLNRKLPKMLTGKNFRLTQTNCTRWFNQEKTRPDAVC